jgi:hypothetical protein
VRGPGAAAEGLAGAALGEIAEAAGDAASGVFETVVEIFG